jgi:hypothetical protein
MKKALITLLFITAVTWNASAQNAPVDLYIGTTNTFSHSWQNNFVSNPSSITTGTHYEGSEHFLFDYAATGWWAAGNLNISNWGSSIKNFSNHTHLVIAYYGTAAHTGNTLRFQLKDNSNVVGATITVATVTATYKVDTIPLSSFVGATALNLGAIKEINYFIGLDGGSGGTTSGQFHIDNVQVIDGRPEINIKAGAVSLISGDDYDFGNESVGISTASTTLTIENTGIYTDLTLTGNPKIDISGTNASDFTVVQTGVISPLTKSNVTSFTVSFTPSAVGIRTAALTISNDDPDEGSYVVNLIGTGIQLPEINIKTGSTNLLSTDTYDFGNSEQSNPTSDITFTIENTGNADLMLTGNPIVTVSGTHASDFTIVQTTTASTVSSSGTTSFAVSFNPSGIGVRTAMLTIENNDDDEGAYVINLTGIGLVTGLWNVRDNNEEKTVAYPTPFNSETIITVKNHFNEPLSLKVFNDKGLEVYASEKYFTNEDIKIGKEFPAGVYFVYVSYENNIKVVKIVKI